MSHQVYKTTRSMRLVFGNNEAASKQPRSASPPPLVGEEKRAAKPK